MSIFAINLGVGVGAGPRHRLQPADRRALPRGTPGARQARGHYRRVEHGWTYGRLLRRASRFGAVRPRGVPDVLPAIVRLRGDLRRRDRCRRRRRRRAYLAAVGPRIYALLLRPAAQAGATGHRALAHDRNDGDALACPHSGDRVGRCSRCWWCSFWVRQPTSPRRPQPAPRRRPPPWRATDNRDGFCPARERHAGHLRRRIHRRGTRLRGQSRRRGAASRRFTVRTGRSRTVCVRPSACCSSTPTSSRTSRRGSPSRPTSSRCPRRVSNWFVTCGQCPRRSRRTTHWGSVRATIYGKEAIVRRLPVALAIIVIINVFGGTPTWLTRSVLQPVKAIVFTTTTSLTATFGALVFIFHGDLRWLVGDFTSPTH